MDNYLIDRETLAEYVDEIMKQKPAPVNTPEELNALREQNIQELDKRIKKAIVNSLTEPQQEELLTLLDSETVTEEDFQAFFDRAGVNIEQMLTNAIVQFGKEYLGDGNGSI